MVVEDDSAAACAGPTWVEVSVETDGEGAEAVSELFNRYGTGGAVVSIDCGDAGVDREDVGNAGPVTVKAYFPAGKQGTETRRRLEEGLWHLGQLYPLPSPTFRVLAYRDWATAWKKYFPILHIGQRVVIKPSWLEYPIGAGEIVVELDPGMAFGTGLHPTTRMCILALEELVQPGIEVLDLGTGSGILSIVAAHLGAGAVLGLDTDLVAVEVARANVAANRVADRVQVKQGSLDGLQAGVWHVIAVNILASTIIELLNEGLASRLVPGGALVAAGIVESQVGEVRQALSSKGLVVTDHKQEKDWVTLVARS